MHPRPCRMIAPIYEEEAKKYPGVKFVKIDVDEHPNEAASFKIASIPTFVFLNGTKVVKTFAGADKKTLMESAEALSKI
jgi:thioredoxin 1